MKGKIKIAKYEKILHWFVFMSILGLFSTSLAAEYFFSKEAIMDSFKESLAILDLKINPAEYFLISSIARRNTWDIHLYFGLAFATFFTIWFLIALARKNKKNKVLKVIFFISSVSLIISGGGIWLRPYYPLSGEGFVLLMRVHYYAYLLFIYTLIVHIAIVIYKENKKSNGAIAKMINFKTIVE